MDSHTPLTPGTEAPMATPPLASAVLGTVAMLPVLAGAIAVWFLPGWPVARLAAIWAGAIVCFLAGVRRGLSFRQPGGSTLGELATMFVIFVAGVAALLVPFLLASLALAAAGFVLLAVFDTRAARRGEAPRYFAKLRPAQMVLPVGSLIVLALFVLTRS